MMEMWKRWMAVGLAVSLLVSNLPMSVLAVDETSDKQEALEVTAQEPQRTIQDTGEWISVDGIEGGQISFDADTGTITAAETTITSAEIPGQINGVDVTTIEEYAFANCGITSLTIPGSLTTFESAFCWCESLTEIVILEGVSTIGDSAFSGCIALERVSLPSSVTSIDIAAFSSCEALVTMDLPEKLEYIGESAFSDCVAMTSIILPASVTHIDSWVFCGCEALTTIQIPENVAYIGDAVFYRCNHLTAVEVSEDNAFYSDVEGVLLGQADTELLYYPMGKSETSYSIPSGVESTAYWSFAGCTQLTEITLPETLTCIGERSFGGCTGLESITIPSSVSIIAAAAFGECESLQWVEFLGDIDAIEDEVFWGCTSLVDIEIPESVTYIGIYAFGYCTSLEDVTLPAGLETIEYSGFRYCASLESIELPQTLETIGAYAFAYCERLQSIVIPLSVGSIGECAFKYCESLYGVYVEDANTAYASEEGVLFNKDKTVLMQYPNMGWGDDYSIPRSVTTILEFAFLGNKNLETIEIPDCVTTIGAYAFSDCEKLRSIEIPQGVTTIEACTFDSCPSLESVVIPQSVTTIEYWAFRYCDALSAVYYPGTSSQWYDISIGTNNTGLTNATKYYNWEAALTGTDWVWVDGVVGGQLSFDYDTGTIVGADTTLTSAELPTQINGVAVSAIGQGAFVGCEELSQVSIPSSVKTIGDLPFVACFALTDIGVDHDSAYFADVDGVLFDKDETLLIAFPSGRIPTDGLYTIPTGVAEIAMGAFLGASDALTTVSIPSSVEIIGDYAFACCYGLTKVTVKGTETVFGSDVFYRSVYEESNFTVGDYVFTGEGKTAAELTLYGYTGSTTEEYALENDLSFSRISTSGGSSSSSSFAGTGTASVAYGESGSVSFTYKTIAMDGLEAEDPYGILESYYISEKILYFTLIDDGVAGRTATITVTSSEMSGGITITITALEKEEIDTPTGIETISVDGIVGALVEFDYDTGTIYNVGNTVTSANIPSKIDGVSVVEIDEGAFLGASNLTSVTIPTSVTTLGRAAFAQCSALTSIVIPDSVTSFGAFMFIECTKLENVSLPVGLKEIPEYTFSSCSSLKTIHIPAGVTTLGASAFSYCTSLTGIELPEYLTAVGEFAFSQSGLRTIELPDEITYVGDGAFGSCYSLQSAKLPKGISAIGEHTFSNCYYLTSIELPSGVTSVGPNAFHSCCRLASVIIPTTLTTVGASAFLQCGLTDVYYQGSEAQWSAIAMDSGNTKLTDATIHYYSDIGTDWFQYFKTDVSVEFDSMLGGTLTYDDFYYDEFWFFRDSYTYDHQFATMSLGLAMAGFDGGSSDTTGQYAKALFQDLGFESDSFASVGYEAQDDDSVAMAMSTKTITNADGEEYTLLAVTLRGSGYGTGGWIGNAQVGESGPYHEGFEIAAVNAQDVIEAYIQDNNLDSDSLKIWLTGYSRSAAVANILSIKLRLNDICDAQNLYTYTFATPNNSVIVLDYLSQYNNIYNIINPNDVVPLVPPSAWTFGKYGTTLQLPSMNNGMFATAYYDAIQDQFQSVTNGGASYTTNNTISATVTWLNYTMGSVFSSRAEFYNYLQEPVYAYMDDGDVSHFDYLLQGVTTVDALLEQIGDADYAAAAIDMFAVLNKTPSTDPGYQLISAIYDVFAGAASEYLANGSKGYDNIGIVIALKDVFENTQSANLFKEHWPEVYLSWMTAIEQEDLSETDAFKSKTAMIACPVDVNVYDEAGNLVAQVIDDVAQEIEGSTISVAVLGESNKVFVLPNDQEYRIEILATDEGTMDYTILEQAGDGSISRTTEYYEIPLAVEQSFEAVITSEENSAQTSYITTSLTDSQEQTVIYADYDSYDARITLDGIVIDGDTLVFELYIGEDATVDYDTASIVVAVYDEAQKMVDCQVLTQVQQGENTIDIGSVPSYESGKLFLLDGEYRPVIQAIGVA